MIMKLGEGGGRWSVQRERQRIRSQVYGVGKDTKKVTQKAAPIQEDSLPEVSLEAFPSRPHSGNGVCTHTWEFLEILRIICWLPSSKKTSLVILLGYFKKICEFVFWLSHWLEAIINIYWANVKDVNMKIWDSPGQWGIVLHPIWLSNVQLDSHEFEQTYELLKLKI